MRALRRVLIALTAVLMGVLSIAGTAGATTSKFHAHVDAYGDKKGCRTEWSSHYGACSGYANDGNAGTSLHIRGLDILWCDIPASINCSTLFNSLFTQSGIPKPAMPPGYTREMLLDTRDRWIYGAVKKPNGPMLVLGGFMVGKPIVGQDRNKAVESDGGPLFLYVGYHGQGPTYATYYEYVFGFRGYLKY
ncbi:MAG: hypothetical protein QOJ44_913 [Acidimicrobiaceae bacterium]|nr:hypothetical protein [Acidimicrobiaceae bacterium]